MATPLSTSTLPDWRASDAYREAAKRLADVTAALPELAARALQAEASVAAAQLKLDEAETLVLAGRARGKEAVAAKKVVDEASAELERLTQAQAGAEREARLLSNGLAMIEADAKAEVSAALAELALASIERCEAAMAEAVAAQEAHHALMARITAQFPGSPADAAYARGLGCPDWPWSDLRNERDDRGAHITTRYSSWRQAVAQWKRERKARARAHVVAQPSGAA